MRRVKQTAYLVCMTLTLVGSRLSTISSAADEAPATDTKAIVVRVVNQAGQLQPDIAVSLFGYNEDWRYWQNLDRDTRTDETGIAHYDGLPKDESYVVRAKSSDNLVGYRQCVLTGEDPRHEADVKVEQPIATSIRVRDEAGKPIAGARIWSIPHTGSNGSVKFDWQTFESFGLSAEPSDNRGELQLPALPPGTLDVRLIHPDYAPCTLKGVVVGQESVTEAILIAGVRLTLRLEMDSKETAVDSIVIDLRRKPFDHPSTSIGRLPALSEDGSAKLTVAAGKYSLLRLNHPEYAVVPTYSERYGSTIADLAESFEVQPARDVFTFRVKPKVKVRGRVIDESTGEPMAEMYVEGKLPSGTVAGPFAPFADEWTHIGWGETDNKGEYEVQLAAGPARVSFEGRGLVATPEYHDLDVAPDGSTVVPDFVVGPMPKVRGVVHDQEGKPVPNAVVRFRGSLLTFAVEPVMTDEHGQFELAPPWIPEDLQTHERLPAQAVVAFHSTVPLYAHREVRLDDADSLNNVVLQLEPQDFDSLITRFSADLTPWQRGIVPDDRKAELAAVSLVGKSAPELDGAHWLNSPKPTMSLADFRGKYVLLQFWTTWCGPCHADIPSLRLLDELYHEKGLVLIGVHDNSMPLAAIEADVAKERLAYPIVVDHPDGRILASYKAHGIAGYPSYVLVGPDGTVLKDDSTVAGPSLRSFKIEIIRQLLLDGSSESP